MDRSATNVNIDVDVSTMNHVIKLPAHAITDVAVDSGVLAVSFVSWSANLFRLFIHFILFSLIYFFYLFFFIFIFFYFYLFIFFIFIYSFFSDEPEHMWGEVLHMLHCLNKAGVVIRLTIMNLLRPLYHNIFTVIVCGWSYSHVIWQFCLLLFFSVILWCWKLFYVIFWALFIFTLIHYLSLLGALRTSQSPTFWEGCRHRY